jgi:NADH-quinone oxidoreductase subunit N
LGALNQKKIKRFIAYSSLNQMGFILLGIACGSFQGIIGSFSYFLIYLVTITVFFLTYSSIKSHLWGQNLIFLSDFSLLRQRSDYIIIFSFVFFSLAGIPPFAGFFGKYMILYALMDSGLRLGLVFFFIFSCVSAFYYLRVIKVLIFDKVKKRKLLSFQKVFTFLDRNYFFCLFIFIVGFFYPSIINTFVYYVKIISIGSIYPLSFNVVKTFFI